MAGVKGQDQKRVWIDSQTEEEILRGIRDAKDWSEYDNLAASAYLRAKEDYLMGILFSSAHLKIWPDDFCFLKADRTVLSVGRVMTCVLGMVSAPGEGNPQFREDAILPGDWHVFIPGYEV